MSIVRVTVADFSNCGSAVIGVFFELDCPNATVRNTSGSNTASREKFQLLKNILDHQWLNLKRIAHAITAILHPKGRQLLHSRNASFFCQTCLQQRIVILNQLKWFRSGLTSHELGPMKFLATPSLFRLIPSLNRRF